MPRFVVVALVPLLAPALLLSGCAGGRAAQKPSGPDDGFRLALSPASYGGELNLRQRITLTRNGESRTLDAQLEVDATVVRVAALAMGQTYARLSWDGVRLEKSVATEAASALSAERILSELQLAWWPREAVRAGLPAGFTLEASERERVVRHEGQPFLRLTYEGQGPAFPKVRIEDLRYGYVLLIESVPLDE